MSVGHADRAPPCVVDYHLRISSRLPDFGHLSTRSCFGMCHEDDDRLSLPACAPQLTAHAATASPRLLKPLPRAATARRLVKRRTIGVIDTSQPTHSTGKMCVYDATSSLCRHPPNVVADRWFACRGCARCPAFLFSQPQPQGRGGRVANVGMLSSPPL